MTRRYSIAQLPVRSYPIRFCRTMHECAVCGQTITLGQRYYDGGYGRRVHEVPCAAACLPPAAAEGGPP